ncbi:MAG: PepSY domain-containing protein [Anaerococcus sp.]|nr:PepSY domain-containing protein [Anaerococcus sp.]
MNKKIIALALAGGLVLSACANGETSNQGDDGNETETSQVVDDNKEDVSDDTKDNTDDDQASSPTSLDLANLETDLDKAVDSFNTHFEGKEISITDISLEVEDNKYVYDFEGFDGTNEYQALIDAETFEVLKEEVEEEPDNEMNEVIDLSAIISPDEAIKKAEEISEGGKALEWSLSVDDGKTIYEVDLDNKDDVGVDGLTGEAFLED